ncbi:RibD family protein, partial [Aspergillus aculeatinus CBS 121060]
RDALTFPAPDRAFLEPHLPPPPPGQSSPTTDHAPATLPFTTLTFATSLDSSLALSPGTRTVLSGPQSKAMTHYLRSRHDAILVGVGTAVADDPGLNCRLAGGGGYGADGLDGQPRPIIVDPSARWRITPQAKIVEMVRRGRGRAPWVLIAEGTEVEAEQRGVLEGVGGRFISLPWGITTQDFGGDEGEGEGVGKGRREFDWRQVLEYLRREEGVRSVMIEGGAAVINSLLEPRYQDLVSSVIVTVAPTWLGRGGVVVSPPRRVGDGGVAVPASRLTGVKWYPFGEDVVLCGRI